MLDYRLQSLLTLKCPVITTQPASPLYKNIVCAIYHDLRYTVIIKHVRKHIQSSEAIEQIPFYLYLIFDTQRFLQRILKYAHVDDTTYLIILYITR